MPEQKLEVPNISIAWLLQELEPLVEGAYVEKAQDLPKKWFKLRLKSKSGQSDLVFSQNSILKAEYRADALQQSSGFGAFLKKRILGKKILSLEQLGSERIIELKFEEFSLVAELFGKGNILLLDKGRNILRPFKRESWSARTLATGEPYALPPARGVSPPELTEKKLKEILSQAKADIVRALLSGINIPPVMAEEACARAGVDKAEPAKKISPAKAKKLCSEIKGLYSKPCPKSAKPCLVLHSNASVLLPFKPVNKLEVLQEFSSLNSALNELVLLPFLKPEPAEAKKESGLERTLAEQQAALEQCENSAELDKKKAELIYAHYSELMKAVNQLRSIPKGKEGEKRIMYKMPSGRVLIKEVNLKKKRAAFEVS